MEDPLRSRQSRNPELLSSLSSRIPFSFPTPHPERRFWGIPLAELWSNPVPLQEVLRFLESRTNPRSQENPSRSWIISEMVSLHLRWTPFLASWHHFFFPPVIALDTELCRIETLEVLEISRNIKFEVMGGVPATKYTLINHWAGRLKIIGKLIASPQIIYSLYFKNTVVSTKLGVTENFVSSLYLLIQSSTRKKCIEHCLTALATLLHVAYILCTFPTIPNRISRFSS